MKSNKIRKTSLSEDQTIGLVLATKCMYSFLLQILAFLRIPCIELYHAYILDPTPDQGRVIFLGILRYVVNSKTNP